MKIRLPLAFLLVGAVTACAVKVPQNQRLEHWTPDAGYRQTRGRDYGEIFFAIAMSGGGTRAASLSYGALEELRNTTLPSGESLLSELDLVFGVSGGSVVAAYYGLYGERIFEDFEARVLKRDVQREMVGRLFWPRYWPRRGFDAYDRTDITADFYSKDLFEEATFADLEGSPGPIVQISATDVSTGSSFAFVQDQFDLICSDLSSFAIGRAVAASAAVPGLFIPMTLANFAGTCGYEPPPWVAETLAQRDVDSRRFQAASIMQSYQDSERRPFVHLVDGGGADNLGLRHPLERVIGVGGLAAQAEHSEIRIPPRILIVVVDAMINPDRDMDRSASPPGAFTTVNTLMGVANNRYTLETVDLLNERFPTWLDQLEAEGGGAHSLHVVRVGFSRIPDPEERRFFDNIPTNFHLPDATVDRLRALSRRQVRASPDFSSLVQGVGASFAPEQRAAP